MIGYAGIAGVAILGLWLWSLQKQQAEHDQAIFALAAPPSPAIPPQMNAFYTPR